MCRTRISNCLPGRGRWLLAMVFFFVFAAPPAVAVNISDDDELVVATRAVPPFAVQDEAGEWRGITIDLWDEIATDRGYSYRIEARSIAEMFEGLQDGSIDVAAAALTITAERERMVDFTHPFYHSGLGIATTVEHRPGWFAVLRGVFSGPFVQALGLLLVLLLATGFVVWLFERRRNAEQFGGTPAEGIGAAFWWSAVTMTTVGYGDKAPLTVPGRLVALIWMFASIIAISGITAAFASALTVASLETGIRGPEDLPVVRVGTVAETTSQDYLDGRMIRQRTFRTVEELLEALAGGQIDAAVYDAPILSYQVNRYHRDALIVLPREFEFQDYGLAVAEDSPLRQEINRSLLDVLESPQWTQIKQRYLGE